MGTLLSVRCRLVVKEWHRRPMLLSRPASSAECLCTWICSVLPLFWALSVVLPRGVCTLEEQGHNIPRWGTDRYTATSTLISDMVCVVF